MINRQIEQVTFEDIESIITDGVAEDRTLDFKQELLLGSRDDKKSFLEDVVAMANAGGGDIVYGLEPEVDSRGIKTGRAKAISPFASSEIDSLKLTAENLVRDSTDPRVSTMHFHFIDCPDDAGVILLLRVGQSWTAPHMNKMNGRFHSRNNAGNYPMDAGQIREAFMLARTTKERITDYVESRIQDHRLDRIIHPGEHGSLDPILLVHMIPIEALASLERGDAIERFNKVGHAGMLVPPFYNVSNPSVSYHYEGIRVDNGATTYAQLSKEGILEFYWGRVARPNQFSGRTNAIDAQSLVEFMVKATASAIVIFRAMEITAPVAMTASFLSIQRSILSDQMGNSHTLASRHDDLRFPPVIFEASPETDPYRVPRSLLDWVWQSYGRPNCPFYDKDGLWMRKRNLF